MKAKTRRPGRVTDATENMEYVFLADAKEWCGGASTAWNAVRRKGSGKESATK
jgi:hypothetical protein